MARKIIYSFLAFAIFGITGILVGSSFYPAAEDTQKVTFIALCFGILGIFVALIGGQWMNRRGEQKLETLSRKPKAMYAIAGAVGGSLIGTKVTRFIDPTDQNAIVDLLVIALSILLCASLCLYLARKFNLRSIDPPTY